MKTGNGEKSVEGETDKLYEGVVAPNRKDSWPITLHLRSQTSKDKENQVTLRNLSCIWEHGVGSNKKGLQHNFCAYFNYYFKHHNNVNHFQR